LRGVRERIEFQHTVFIVEPKRELKQKIHAQHAPNFVIESAELRERYRQGFLI
jgi:hypothetical protein